MKRLVVVGIAIALTVAAALAQPTSDQQYTTGTVKYRLGSMGKLHDKPEPPCQERVTELGKLGTKVTLVRTKPGISEHWMICVFRYSDGTQSDHELVQKRMICADGTEAISKDKTGTWKSQGCPCDPATGCPQTGSAGSGSAKPPDRCEQFRNHPTCTAEKSPPGPERSKRCTQEPAYKNGKKLKPKAQVARDSTSNRAKVGKENPKLQREYGEARRGIEDDLIAKKEDKTGDVKGRRDVWEKFGPEAMCEGSEGYNDVNIGMPCGTYDGDFAAANNVAGLGETPPGCTWHHHQDLGRMQLVKSSAHTPGKGGPAHTGGLAIWRKVFNAKSTPLCCPEPKP
ncbi:MAG: HNH endonuclease [Kofleriaceae bacterium]